MRTIQVVNVRWYNATAWYGVTVARTLSETGHPSLVVGLADTPPLARARELGLPVAALPLNSPASLPALWGGMRRVIRDFRPDVVNCHRGESFILWALARKWGNYALIRTRGDRRPPKGGVVNRWLHCRAADAVIATNSDIAHLFRARLRVPAEKLHTILGGVDTERFRPHSPARREVRERLGLTDQDVVVGLVGRLDDVKGVRESLFALGRAVSQGSTRLRLILVGFPSQFGHEAVSRWAAEAGLKVQPEADAADRRHDDWQVWLTDRVARPEDWINAFDIGLLASLGSEAIARAALEIMACGVPLLSSRVGVMPDLLPADYLFEPGDTAGMAALMLRAADELEQSRRGAESAWMKQWREHCRRRIYGPIEPAGLTLADFRNQTLTVYEQALASRGL